jgi:hypothetical protein
MKNREMISKTCTYDNLVNMLHNTGMCPLQAVAGISRETKILRCYKYIHDGCEKCIQNWLNEEVSTDFSNKCNN